MKAGVDGDRPIRQEHPRRRVCARRPATRSHATPTSIRHEPPPLIASPARYSWATLQPTLPIDHDALLGEVVRALRLGAGLTCEEAGRRSGLGPSRVAGLEEGDGLLLFTDAIPLAAALGSSLSTLARLIERAAAAPIDGGDATGSRA
ncbi:MAG TPA: helix-turn-helix transcriptional regulator [Candidatus Limnocylindrales bacterium]|jgi:hypothetical protein